MGNTTTCTADVTVTHNTAGKHAPEISGCPADVTYSADSGTCSKIVTYTPPTATDVVNGFQYDFAECFWTISEPGDSDVDFLELPGLW